MEKEFYEEFEDMEAGIDQKQALVEESKKLDEIEDFQRKYRQYLPINHENFLFL